MTSLSANWTYKKLYTEGLEQFPVEMKDALISHFNVSLNQGFEALYESNFQNNFDKPSYEEDCLFIKQLYLDELQGFLHTPESMEEPANEMDAEATQAKLQEMGWFDQWVEKGFPAFIQFFIAETLSETGLQGNAPLQSAALFLFIRFTLAVSSRFHGGGRASQPSIEPEANTIETNSTEALSTNLLDRFREVIAEVFEVFSGNSEQLNIISSALNELTANFDELSTSAGKAAIVSSQMLCLTTEGRDNIDNLSASIEEVNSVLRKIHEISEQTSLLALNASIQAARAGDAGRGFNVVANEVKELSRQSASSSVEIKQRVEAIQSSSEKAIQTFNAMTDLINELSSINDGFSDKVTEQNFMATEVSGGLMSISASAEMGIDTLRELKNETEEAELSQA